MKQDYATIQCPKTLFEEAKLIKSTSVETAITKTQEALRLAQEQDDANLEFEILLFLGRTFRMQGEAFDSIEQLNKAYRTLNHRFSQDKIKLSSVYREYGSLYSDCFGDHATGLDYSRKALSLNNEKITPALYNNIGCQYVHLEQYDKATYYLMKGKETSLARKDHQLLSFIYENFGEMYRQQEKHEEAIASYESGIASANNAVETEKDIQAVNYIHCYNLIGLANIYLKEGQLHLVAELIKEVYDKSTTSKLQSCWSAGAIIEGAMFLKNNEVEAFLALFEKASLFCSENALHQDRGIWLRKMIDLCESKGKYKEALLYSKKLIENKTDRESKTKAVNITKVLENKEMEILALENRNRETQIQKDQLEQFAYIVAHDLKTPLSNISNFVGLFSKKYGAKVNKEDQYYLDFVLTNSKQLHLMFDELLHYITVKEIKKDAPICNMERLIARVNKKYGKEIAARNGSIKFDLLPKVKVHCAHLEVILDRMIANGIKFSRKDKDLRLQIDVKETLDEYRFSVSDNGIGIEEDYRQKIFDLFKRLDKVNYSGIGMGLAICKKIVNMYGGEIEVSTNDWGGTTFVFNIPKSNYTK